MRKRLFALLMVVFMLIAAQTTAYAARDSKDGLKYSEKPTVGVEAKKDNQSLLQVSTEAQDNTGSLVMTAAYDGPAVIDMWGVGIYKVSSTLIYGFAETVADRYVEEVGYSIDFQVWNGYYWETFDYGYDVSYNDVSAEGYHYRNVTPGKYYRILVDHYLTNEGYSDYEYSESKYIYVD